ncbi:MAG: rhodanese-related sulfurtransferase [Candidatus Azotimanducaceae bacterium]|jgi:rhodanese-related sulfurtransferase
MIVKIITPTRFISFLIFSLFYSGTLLAELVDIDNTELQKLLNEKTLIIDVRRAEEWSETGVIKSSQLLTFFDKAGNVDTAKWHADLAQISDKTTPVIVICRSGARSKKVGNWLLTTLGYETVYNVTGGIVGWKNSDGETVTPGE